MIKDLIFDLETLHNEPNSIVLDISVIAFDPDPLQYKDNDAFINLVEQGKSFKLSVKKQRESGRVYSQSTIDWWKKQSDEAKKVLKPLDTDLSVHDAITEFMKYVESNGIKKSKSQIWCRGLSFDVPILKSLLMEAYPNAESHVLMPITFRNERDIRTAIEGLSLVRGMTETPLHKGSLEGFIHHNSVHDCAKDVLMLQRARLYAMGEMDPPESTDDTDPASLPKGVQ